MSEPSFSSRAGGPKTDADADDPESDGPGGFAISVDLSACVGAHARCRIWVRRRARKVQWLASRVRRVAKLKGPLLLMAGEHVLPPGEPLRVLHPKDTLNVTRVEQEWQHAFSIDDSDEDVIQPSPAIVQSSPIESTKQSTNKSMHIVEPQLVAPMPATKRRFTVGDTIRMLNQRMEEPSMQTCVTQEPSEPELIKQTKKSEYFTQKLMSVTEHSLNSVHECDALNLVKRRALALLEQVAERKEDTDVVDAPKKKRRRVRRRRPARTGNPEEGNPDNSESETVHNTSGTQAQITNNCVKNMCPKDKENSMSETVQNGFMLQPSEKHLYQDTTSEPETLQSDAEKDLGPIAQNGSMQANSNSQAQSLLPSNPSMLAAQTSLTLWTKDSQEPVVFRNPTRPPRAPRVVHALGLDTPCCDATIGGC